VHLTFVDIDSEIVQVLERQFHGLASVRILHGDITQIATDTIVSPGNSRGMMTGGVDAVLAEHFGPELEERVLQAVERRGGLVRVGDAVTVITGNARVPRLILAPTMEYPSVIPAANCFFAMMAVLRESARNGVTREVFSTALGTGTGHVPPEDAVREMHAAVVKWRARH